MAGFSSLIAQHQPVNILKSILRNGAIPHALLFTGIEGVGKRSAALAFAMALNCQAGNEEAHKISGGEGTRISQSQPEIPCGRCRSCQKIESGNHPDIITVEPSGVMIKIAQIRELCRVLAMKPYEGGYRVAVISEADSMNTEAGNALLKMLEEPPHRTIMILTAAASTDMLPTIVSRCRHIRFSPIPVSRIADELEKSQGISRENAYGIAVLSGGSLKRATALSKSNWNRKRAWLMDLFEGLIQSEAGRRDSGPLFAAAAVISADKELTKNALEAVKTFYRDMLVYRHQPDNLLNPDMKSRIAGKAQIMGEESILDKIGAVDIALERIRSNANTRLTLETLFLTLAKYPEMN